MICLVGRNTALLEGLAQSLARVDDVVVATSLTDAEDQWGPRAPTLLVVPRSALTVPADARPPKALGATTAIVTYREAAAPADTAALPPDVARMILADLELPLERHRLAAFAERLVDRARERGQAPTPPVTGLESPAS